MIKNKDCMGVKWIYKTKLNEKGEIKKVQGYIDSQRFRTRTWSGL